MQNILLSRVKNVLEYFQSHRIRRHGANIASHGVFVYAPTFTDTQCTYPRGDG